MVCVTQDTKAYLRFPYLCTIILRKMKDKKELLWTIIGTIIGLVGGFFYYDFVGCENGCPIKSNPWLMSGYGSLMGGIGASLAYSINKKSKNKI